MKNTIKKISAFLLSLVLLLGIVPLADLDIIASAETYSGTCGDNLTWTLDTETGELVISGEGEMLKKPWRSYPDSIKNVTIGNGVTSIGDVAFFELKNLKSIDIPDSVTAIGLSAFQGCTNLTDITISDNITSIGEYAFENTGYMNDTTNWINNVLYIGDYLIKAGVNGDYAIKDGTKTIASSAFARCYQLTGITIPNSVTNIDYNAFKNCSNLTNMTIGNGSISIYNTAFDGCDNLTNLTFGNGSTCVGDGESHYSSEADERTGNFSDALNKLPSFTITITEGVTSINDWAFDHCTSLTKIVIPDSVTSIGDRALSNCYNLKDVIVPKNVTDIGGGAFAKCSSLTDITIPNSVKNLGWEAFYKCVNLVNIKISEQVAVLDENVFYGCVNLTDIEIPDSVTEIGYGAFEGCTGLTDITIPDGVTKIRDYAFEGCTSLTSITVDEKNTRYSNDEYGVLFNKDKTSLVRYPIGNKRTNYKIPDGVTGIDDSAFSGCIGLTSITVDEKNTRYSNDEYGVLFNKDKTRLDQYPIGNKRTNYEIPDGVTDIDNNAFRGCIGLTTVTIGNSVKNIDYYAFYTCDSLTDVYYNGTEEQWNEITVESYNDPLINATIHFLGHECDYTAVVTPPTCQTQGYTTYTCEECGDSYVDDYTDTVDHYYLDGKCIWCGDTNVTPSSIIDITYTPSDSAHKLFTVTCADRAQMIQFIEPDGGTRTYYRNNANVKITSYNADGEVVGELSRDLAYEVWEIYSNMSIGTTIKVRAKFQSRWELDKRSLFIYEYNPVISMELSRTSGKKGPVPATVVADEKTENVKFKMPNGTSVTVTQFTTDENGNRVFKGNAWANEDGLNVITVTIRRKNVTKTVGTLEYTVE
ncbi:MAG: leucine-rich repeat domain-containing protein [Clostridia bacterium]|nr:leucine-rich repeat domain-containing protein [Clostridia bacterium]